MQICFQYDIITIMEIRNISFAEKPLFLAPMAGVSDVGFRRQACKFGADVTVTEMLSARAMAHNPKKTALMTITDELEKLTVAQIFGHESEYMVKAIQSKILEKFPAFDINMGCPAPKIVKNGEGGALMDNIPLASKIISECRKSTDKPLSVKFRKGNSQENYLDFARMCEESGADFITFHARTVGQGYSGHADYDAIAKVKANVKIKVIGNGDVVDAKSYELMLQTGVDGVMIGRGALGSPWVFAELKNSLSNEKVDNTSLKEEKIDINYDNLIDINKLDKFSVVEDHISTLRKYYEEDWLKLYIRKHLLWYAKDLPLASELRLKLATCNDIDFALQILKQAFL